MDPTVVYTNAASAATASNNSPRLLRDSFGKLFLLAPVSAPSGIQPAWSNDGGATWVLGPGESYLEQVCECAGIQYGRWTITRDSNNNVTGVTPPVPVVTLASSGRLPSLVLDQNGSPAVAWSDVGGVQFLRARGDPSLRASWVNATGTSTTPDSQTAVGQVAVLARMPAGTPANANDDALYLFWVDGLGGALKWSRARVSGTDYLAWSAAAAKPTNFPLSSLEGSLTVVADPGQRGLVFAYTDGVGRWGIERKGALDDRDSADVKLFGGAALDWPNAYQPVLGLDRGDLYAIYQLGALGGQIAYRRNLGSGTSWDATDRVLASTSGNTSPALAPVQDSGLLDLAWSTGNVVNQERFAASRPLISGVVATPSPFDAGKGQSTRIDYSLADDASPIASVRVTVVNARNEPVRTLVNTSQATGARSVVWDGKDGGGVTGRASTLESLTTSRAAALNTVRGSTDLKQSPM